MFTILEKSDSVKKLRSFRQHRWTSSNSIPNSATKTFWRVSTPVHRFVFIKFMKLKILFDKNLNDFERRFILDLDNVLSDDILVATLSVLSIGFEREITLKRMNDLFRFFAKDELTENLFFTLEGTIPYVIEECRQSIREAEKFSGYVRNSSKVGSKRPSGSKPEPEIGEWSRAVKYDFISYLTVGEFSSDLPGGSFFTLTRNKIPKR